MGLGTTARKPKVYIPVSLAVLVVIIVAAFALVSSSGGAKSSTQKSASASTSGQTSTPKSATSSTSTTLATSSTTSKPSAGSSSSGSSSASGSKTPGGSSSTPPPVTTTPPPSGPCGGASCILPGDNGVVGALNALRAAHGLPPVTSSSSTSMTQNCALNGNGSPCGNNEAATGVIGNSADGNQAVNNWMSVSSSLLLEPGVSAGGAYNFHVDVGWAWVAGAGHGYVAVISVCANTPNAVVYC